MYPPVAVSPFKAAADLERLLAEKHGNVGAGRLMYLKHLYMIWCVLGGRELAAAAEAAAEAERAEEEAAAAAAAQQAGQQQEGGHHLTVAAQRKQQAAEAAIARAQQVLEGAVGVADAVAVRAALLDGQVTVQDVFDMTCSKLGFDQQRDK
jgi:pyruvate/2-oxoglutarate dehydrogenase complex dihydrolipoamide acyltransferase (E2) component